MGQQGSCLPLPENDTLLSEDTSHDLSQEAGAPVTLHVYDVHGDATVRLVNEVFRSVGTGLFHAGVEVYGAEWSYGYRDEDGTGIFSVHPKGNPVHTYRETVALGRTRLLPIEVLELLNKLGPAWLGRDYDIVSYNCLDFCGVLSDALGTGRVPAWATNFVGTSAPLLRGCQAIHSASSKVQDWWYSTRVVLECVYANTVDVGSMNRRDRCIVVTIPADTLQPVGPRQQPTAFSRLVPELADFPAAHLAHDHAFELAWEPPCLYLRKPCLDAPLLVNGAPVRRLTHVLLHNSEISLCGEAMSEEQECAGGGAMPACGDAPRLTFRVLRSSTKTCEG